MQIVKIKVTAEEDLGLWSAQPASELCYTYVSLITILWIYDCEIPRYAQTR